MTANATDARQRQEWALDQWKFHSANLWSRLQTVQVVEAAVLAAWYQVGPPTPDEGTATRLVLQLAVLGVGFVLLWMIRVVILRDSEYIDACLAAAAGGEAIVLPSSGAGRGRRIARRVPDVLIAFNAVAVLLTPLMHGWRP